MKRLITLLALSAVCLPMKAELHIVQKKDKYGYADDNGTVVIKEQYSAALPFENNMAKVCKGDKWGYIDESGAQIIKTEYADIGEFNDKGIARVKKGKKYGYIRKDGTFVIKPEYEFIGSFNEKGYVWVAKGKKLDDSKKGLFRDDQMIVKPEYRCLGFYQKTDSCDYADGNYFISSQAMEINENFAMLSTSELPYIWVDKMYSRGILNLDGTQAVKLTNYAMGAPVDGMVQMVQFGKKENKYNYAVLDNKGAKLFPKDIRKTFSEESPFHGCYPFENGVALVYPDDSSAYLIGKDGTPKTGTYTGIIRIPGHGFITQRSGLYGFMDTAGAETIAPTYSLLMAPSLNPESILTAKSAETGKYGFVTTTGQTFIPFEYEQAGFFSHGKGYVRTAGGWGVVDSGNNMIVSPKWQDIVMGVCDNDTHLWVQNPETGKWKCLEIKSGKIAFEDEYDNANAFDKDGMSVVARNGKYSVVRTSGKIVIPERLDTQEVCLKALGMLKEKALDEMSDIDAYRFNIYNHPDINKFTLTQKIESNLWDY